MILPYDANPGRMEFSETTGVLNRAKRKPAMEMHWHLVLQIDAAADHPTKCLREL
jgi:hypothetical protein